MGIQQIVIDPGIGYAEIVIGDFTSKPIDTWIVADKYAGLRTKHATDPEALWASFADYLTTLGLPSDRLSIPAMVRIIEGINGTVRGSSLFKGEPEAEALPAS